MIITTLPSLLRMIAPCVLIGFVLGGLSAAESGPVKDWEIHLLFGFQPEAVARMVPPVDDPPAVPDIQVLRDLMQHDFGSEAAHAYLSGIDLNHIVTGEVAFRLYSATMVHPDRQLAAACERLAFRLLRHERHAHPRFEAIRLLRLHMLTSETVTLFHDLGPEAYDRISLESGLAAAASCLEVNDVNLALELYQSSAAVYAKRAPTMDEDPGPAIVAALEALRPRHPHLEEKITACQNLFRLKD